MGDLIQFRPRARDAVAIKNVALIGAAIDRDRDEKQYAMDDDSAPCELNPDPFTIENHHD